MGQARPQATPSVFGRYETLFRIASGGMAEVYAARVRGEAGFQKLVALKRMLPHLTDDERFVTMFMDEGKLAANISSPNVVSTLDLGRAEDESLYLVMELVVGTTLSTLLRNAAKHGASVPIDVAVEMLAQAAQGLHDAHEAATPFGTPLHIVHRDVSPQNILVGTDGRVRITDFGVARAILRRTKTSTGEFKGKLSYFSPEQCADQGLDRRSDLFSLGVVAWETLTTRRLFHAENPLAVLERVTRMPIPSAHTVRTEVPASVAAVVATALERDRDARFSTAMEFAQALRAAARDTVGIADRRRISDLVQRYGGESLERVQHQLKQTLAARPQPSTPEGDEFVNDPSEVSSGIIVRPEDVPTQASLPSSIERPNAPPPLTAPLAAPGRHEATAISERPAPHVRKSRVPMVIASVVAVLGLGVGASIGILVSRSGEADARIPETETPIGSEPDSTASRSNEAEERAPNPPVAQPADSPSVNPPADLSPEPELEDEAAAEDIAETGDPSRPRRPRLRRPTHPAVRTVTTTNETARPAPVEQQAAAVQVTPPTTTQPNSGAREPAPPAQTQPARRPPGGLMGLDDFQNLGGGR